MGLDMRKQRGVAFCLRWHNPVSNTPTKGDDLGEILSDAVMQVMTPSLEYYDKIALAHVSKYADDYTGHLIDRHGNFRRGCIGICLLYTSPSPRDRQKSRMPSSA